MSKYNFRSPVNMIAAVNLIAFSLLYIYKSSFDSYLLLVGGLLITLIYIINFILVKANLGDIYLFSIVAMLASLGVIMLYRLDPTYGFKQIVWFGIGSVLFFITYFVYYKWNIWEKLVYVYPIVSFVLFTLTLTIGTTIKGATNWIQIGGHTFQPSELIKVLFIFFLAAYYAKPEKLNLKILGKELKSKYICGAIVYAHMGFLVLQKEFGVTLLLFLIYFAFLYIFEEKKGFLLLNLVFAGFGAFFSFYLVHHLQIRVETWLNPWTDISGAGYQITQSLFAIGSGGFFGRGLGLGRPDFIPEVHTDFIFSAICEEMGIFGGIAVVLLYFILSYRGIKMTLAIKDLFQKCVALGLTVMFGFQTFIIIGGVIKLIPLTGITLPFISYGGSSLTISFIALGILQAISKKSTEGEGEKLYEAK